MLRRPAISVVCPTAHPGPVVAEVLGAVRDAVDEIIVAADSRVGATDLGHYAEIADVLLRYEHCGANRHWPWLAEQAGGDWLLLLDGDELASTALVAALPDLVADRRIRQYSLPIHWVWPDPGSRLAGEPWGTDRRLRLVRNDGRLAFAARKHAMVEPDGPIRMLDELPTYHIDLLLPDRQRREAKVRRYDAELFGLLTPEGAPFNAAFYLPEGGEHATHPLPAADADQVRRALGACHDPAHTQDPASVPLHRRAQIDSCAPGAGLPPDAYRATLAPARALPAFTAARQDHLVWLNVTNDGTARWPGGDSRHPLVRVGVAWQPIEGGGPPIDLGRTALPHALDPGETTLVAVEVCAPPEPGPAELVLDLVHERVRWFGCTFRARLDVWPSAAQRLAALSARHGALVPLDEVMCERRTVGTRDGLLRPSSTGACTPGSEAAALARDMPVGGWAVDEVTIQRLAELVRHRPPRIVVEFGSGTSTIVLASLLARGRDSGPRVISFEEDAWWAGRTREELKMRGLHDVATVIHLPLAQPADGRPAGYGLTKEGAALMHACSPELVLVDGPTLESGASRLGALDIVAPYVRRDAALLLDDALRDAELCVGQAWQRRGDVTVHGIRPTPKGLLEATLRGGARRWPFSRARVRRLPDSPAE